MQPHEPLISARRPSLDFTGRRSPFAPDASMLVSCIRCRRLHSAARPFEFNPVCAVCAGRLGSLAR
jgi:hypothetical protein